MAVFSVVCAGTTCRKQRGDSTMTAVSRTASVGSGRKVFIDMRRRQAKTPYLLSIIALLGRPHDQLVEAENPTIGGSSARLHEACCGTRRIPRRAPESCATKHPMCL